MGNVELGTSSWTAKGWVGPFYPEGLARDRWLAHYATRFGTVEVDSTYYGVPRRSTVRRWVDQTPEGFTMAAKFPRAVVHRGEGPRPDGETILRPEVVGGEVDAFLGAMGELGARCGPLVIQLPYLNRQAFAGPGPFLERLAAFLDWLPAGFRYAVEVRNKAWVKPPLLALLRERNVALVLVDIRYMPHPEELARTLDLVTADFVYARLIGDRAATEAQTKTFDRVVLDQVARLEGWANLIASYAQRVSFIAAYANNHYAGHAPTTIAQLTTMLEGRGVSLGANG
jgi:uncharacterized protein YecE (DUF72 family)